MHSTASFNSRCDAEKAEALLPSVGPDRRSHSQSFDVKEGVSSPNGISNGSSANSNGIHADAGVVRPSSTPGSQARPRGRPFVNPGGVFGAVRGGGRRMLPEESYMKREEHAAARSHLSPPLDPYRGGDVAMRPMTLSTSSLSPRRPSSRSDSGSRMLQLADLATQELLTMGEEDGPKIEMLRHPRSTPFGRKPLSTSNSSSPPSSPPSSAMSVSSRRRQHHLSGPSSSNSGDPSADTDPASGAIPPRKLHHNHHLRERSSMGRTRSAASRRSYGFEGDGPPEGEDGDGGRGEDDDVEREAAMEAEREAFSARGRRNRPRSVSMPEGMDRERARAFSGGYSSGARRGSQIEAIEEELDGPDGVVGTRSRGWRSGGGGGGNDKGRGDAVVGSVEDAEALIALARRRVGWGAEPQENGGEGSGCAEGGAGGNGEGEGGICVSLPHMLSKYADMYNKNGRIGIYTRQEREAIIARFKRKRGRRVWKKKIRYNCRKNLADKRLRVKGRFVKMSPEQRAALKLKSKTRNSRGSGGGRGAGAGSGSAADMELLDSEEVCSETASRGSGAGAHAHAEGSEEEAVGAEGYDEGEEDEGDDDEDEEEEEEEAFSKETLKRVRRHSIAY